jgi:hypothetical protein
MGINFGSLLQTVAPLALAAVTGGASLAVMAQQMATRAVVQLAIQKIGQELGLPPAMIGLAQMAAGNQMGGADLNDFSNIGGARSFLNQAFQEFSASDQGNINRSFDAYTSAATSFADGLQARSDQIRTTYDQAASNLETARSNGASDREIRRLESRADTAQQDMNKFDAFLSSINLSNSRRKSSMDMKGVMEGKGSLLMKIAILLGMIADQKMADMATKAEQIGKMGEIKGKNQAKFTQMNSELQALGQELGTISQATANVIKSIGEAGSTLARKG